MLSALYLFYCLCHFFRLSVVLSFIITMSLELNVGQDSTIGCIHIVREEKEKLEDEFSKVITGSGAVENLRTGLLEHYVKLEFFLMMHVEMHFECWEQIENPQK